MKFLFLLAGLFTFTTLPSETFAQVKVVKFEELDNYLSKADSDKIKVVNFWATWCAPCIKELPYFEAVDKEYEDNEVEVLLVSLDFADQLDRVEIFLQKKDINSTVWLLDETDANSYIDKVDPRWSGAIPMTIISRASTGQRIFLEKELTKEEIEQHINKLQN